MPIVSFSAVLLDGTRLEGDVNVNHRLGVYNSGLINAYRRLNSIVRPLVMAVKHWAKRRRGDDPKGSQTGHQSFSSYSLTLLVIAYLQAVRVLPNLQEPAELERAQVPPSSFWLNQARPDDHAQPFEWDTRFVDVPIAVKEVKPRLTTPMLSYLIGFFKWVARNDTSRQLISVLHSGLHDRHAQQASFSYHAKFWQGDGMVILDPFQLDRNTAGHVKAKVLGDFRVEVKRAADLLSQGSRWRTVCSEL